MSKAKLMTLPLADLQETFYVRQALSQDRVDFFADLYTSKGEVEFPLAGQIDGEETIHLIDGRHRKHALMSLEVKETECRFQIFETWADMVVAAVQANWGGSLPQTEGDLRHTVRMMLEHGVGRNTLYAKFPFIPRDLMRKLLDHVQADLANARMNLALNAVAEGEITAPQAAKQFGVELADLKRRITREKKPDQAGWGVLKVNISNRFKELSTMLGKQLGTALKMHGSGELSDKAFETVIEHVRRLIKKTGANVDGYEARFNVMVGKSDSPKVAPVVVSKAKGSSTGKSALAKMGL